jgi:RHS repeat-associated protein
VWRWDQAEPFGNNPADEDPDANSVAFDLPLRLPGQRYDAETGLHYNYFRDYDPSLGRYGESDPVGLSGGINTYAYVHSDPLSKFDAKGLFPESLNKQNYDRWVKKCVTRSCVNAGYKEGSIGNWCCVQIETWACSKKGANFTCCDCVKQECRKEMDELLWTRCDSQFLLCLGRKK